MAEDTKKFSDDLHATMSFQTFGTIWMKLIYGEFLLILQDSCIYKALCVCRIRNNHKLFDTQYI